IMFIFLLYVIFFFFSSRRRHTRSDRDWSSDVCSSDLGSRIPELAGAIREYENHLQRENLALKRNIQNWQARLVEMLRDAMLEKRSEERRVGKECRCRRGGEQ